MNSIITKSLSAFAAIVAASALLCCSTSTTVHGESTATPSPLSLRVATSAPLAVGTPNRKVNVGLRTVRYNGDNGVVEVLDVQISPSAARIRVVDVLAGLGKGQNPYQSFNLREVIGDLDPTVAITGASGPSLSTPISLGLVIDNGRTASPLDKHSYFATGLFCIKADGVPEIMYRSHYRVGSCVQAMQSGPVIVEPGGAIGVSSSERARPAHEYLVVATGRDRRLHIVFSTATHLYDLGRHLISDLGATSAIVLGTGIEHTALFVNAPGIRLTRGNLDGAIPSAVVLLAT